MTKKSIVPCCLAVLAAVATIHAQGVDRRLPEPPVLPGRRVALVIGNDTYPSQALRNGRNDARAVAGALRDLGFTTTLLEDATRDRMGQAIAELSDSVLGGDVVFFYFAGHGVQVGGENYLIPVDYRGVSESGVRLSAVSASQVQQTLVKARVSILVLDACRNNPYTAERGSRGLTPMEARGNLIAFATAAGTTASDNPNEVNGLFTQELLTALRAPKMTLREAFNQVRQRVYAASSGRQFPAIYDGLLGDVVLRGDGTVPTAPLPATSIPEASAEIVFWQSLNKNSAADFELYLARHSNGAFVELARNRLKELSAAAKPPVPRTGIAVYKNVKFTQTSDKSRQVEAVMQFNLTDLAITDTRSAPLVTLPYAAIKSAEYSYSKSPRVKSAIFISPLLALSSGKKHWLMVRTEAGFAVLQLDKGNYRQILGELETSIGRGVELVGEK